MELILKKYFQEVNIHIKRIIYRKEHEILQNKYSKKQLEELYNCDIFKDSGFDDSHLFWVAQGLPFTEDGDDCLFVHADGWDLDELHENIREAIREHCIVFDGE
jgi:ATP-dependent Lon protease